MLNLRHRTFAALAVLALGAAGCGGSDDEQSKRAATDPPPTAASEQQTTDTAPERDEAKQRESKAGGEQERKRSNNDPVVEEDAGIEAVGELEVSGSEFALELSEQGLLAEGVWSVTFVNVGTITHALVIEGPNGESRSGRVESGQSKTFKAYLVDGTYELYCPIADHAEKGMRTELPVRG